MKIMRGILIGLAVVLTLSAGIFLGVKASGWMGNSPVRTVTESRSSQVINSVSREDQVVLVSLGIQGYERVDSHGEILGVPIPASGKTVLLPYSFTAKLGIKGKDLKITETKEGHFKITVPEFIFIGNSNVHFEDLIEAGGVLSGTAKKVNQSKLSNRILSNENEAKYVDMNRETLQSQAQAFYSDIVTSIDPNVKLEFEFTQPKK